MITWVDETRCICDDGWSGGGDGINLASPYNIDCGTHIQTILILYILVVLIGAVVMIIAIQAAYRLHK
jgi:hypothetical protein